MIEKFKSLKNSRIYSAVTVLTILIISVIQYISIEIGVIGTNFASVDFIYKFISIIVIVLLDAFLILLIGKIRPAMIAAVLLTTLLAVANHYIIFFHGTPFTFALLKNFMTAMNVIDGYDFVVTYETIKIGLMTGFMLFAAVVFLPGKKVSRKISAPVVAVVLCAVLLCYTGPYAVLKKNVGWSWDEAMRTSGYTPRLVKSIGSEYRSVAKPENYSDADVEDFINSYIGTGTAAADKPDIILILNETFYDLAQITDVNASSDYMAGINGLENTVRGYAVSPSTGGGTNRSEYELLTSNSLYLSPNVTPFNTFELKNSNSVVSYVESLGYKTFAAHAASGNNYRRNTGYRDIGFDTYMFDDGFENLEYYYNRYFATDECVYNNLISWYEQMGDDPRFMYMLTIQNHGDYQFNESAHNTVKTANDYGEYTSYVDEFLTCISMSDEAFVKLTEYFETVDRDVVICMVGDHSPSFANKIVDSKYSKAQRNIQLKSVPYVIWSNNIDLSQTQTAEKIGMMHMVPYFFKTAGIELSGYYDYLNNLRDSVPVMTTGSTYIGADGVEYKYTDTTPYSEKVAEYFKLCYANIKNKDFMKEFTK